MRPPCRRLLRLSLALLVPVYGQTVNSCSQKRDAHGLWEGNVSTGGTYTLSCEKGYAIEQAVGATIVYASNLSIVCPDTGVWAEDPQCIDKDDCSALKNDCGVYGVCVDEVGGYHCACEHGVAMEEADDGSGEWVCKSKSSSVCQGATCGAHGICIDLKESSETFDTGTGRYRGYRCSCAHGYRDNGTTCEPRDCGALQDDFGQWMGSSRFGNAYTLDCSGTYSFVSKSLLQKKTITCPASGRWPAVLPRCVNAWKEAADAQVATFRFWFSVGCSCVCVCFAALAAGLTMGLVSLSAFDMQLLMATREEDCEEEDRYQLRKDKKAAARVQPLLRNHHLLLVTLLLLNSFANEALPLFLDQVVPAELAFLVSVTCVLFFGEILPSAKFTGPDQLWMASKFAPCVRVLVCTFYCLARPIAQLLDIVVGGDHGGSAKYSRAQLMALMRLHSEAEHKAASSSSCSDSESESEPYKELKVYREDVEEGAGHETAGALHRLEGRLAERSLQLSVLRIADLRLELLPKPPAAGGHPLLLQDDIAVAEVLELLTANRLAYGAVKRADGSMAGFVTREALLWAALFPSGPGGGCG